MRLPEKPTEEFILEKIAPGEKVQRPREQYRQNTGLKKGAGVIANQEQRPFLWHRLDIQQVYLAEVKQGCEPCHWP